MSRDSNIPVGMKVSLLVAGIGIYGVVALISAFLLLRIPHWYTIAFSVALFLPHFFALYLVRRPMPWERQTREEATLVLISFAAIPVGCMLFLFLLGIVYFMDSNLDSGFVVLFLAYTIIFTIIAIGTSLIVGSLKISRKAYYASHCRGCLYDLSSVEGGVCPECNTPIRLPEADAN